MPRLTGEWGSHCGDFAMLGVLALPVGVNKELVMPEIDSLRHNIPPPNHFTHGVGSYSECVRMCLMSISLLAAVYPHSATSQA